MSNNFKNIAIVFFASIFTIIGCKKEDKTFGGLTPPATPVITVDIVGKTTANPTGDGSGKIVVTVNAANAINYKVDFGDGTSSATSTNNKAEHTYSFIGVKDFTVTAIASGKAGLSSTASTVISLKKDYTPPADLVTMLTNDASKTWTVDSMAFAHFGVGPVGTFTPDYWPAPVNAKAGLGIYDDEYTFTKAGNVFSHKTNKSIFGKGEFLTDFDPALSASGDYTLIGDKAGDYSETFSYDGAGADEFIEFQGKGHMGLYLGSHRYQILSRSATNMSFRYIGKDGLAWYVKIKAK